jgi:pantetheine-phosphate adenylyltransferase
MRLKSQHKPPAFFFPAADQLNCRRAFRIAAVVLRLYEHPIKQAEPLMQTAVYPGTFDPITNGHTDLVERAARRFERVIVAIHSSTPKEPAFQWEERIELAKTVLADYKNVTVEGFQGLLVEFARLHGAGVILRGLRAVSDFEYEFQLASMNRQLAPEIETLFMTPDEHYAYVSSSLVREVAALGGDVTPFVHRNVVAALDRRFR